jgi:hypothetical protein
MADTKKFVVTDKHKVSLAEAPDPFPTVTVYGKVIDKVSVSPSEDGISHPFNAKEDLHAAAVCGYSHAGVCTRVNPPVQVMLPHPDGEASGCGFDPAQGFVEWRNIPKDWETIHITTQVKPLFHALTAFAPRAAGASSSPEIVQQWANLASLPGRNGDLKTLWAQSGDALASNFNAGAQKLAGMLSPLARPGQTIDQAFILGLSPSTVGQLATQLGF